MSKSSSFCATVLSLAALVPACADIPVPTGGELDVDPLLDVVQGSGNHGGAVVNNSGEGKPQISCYYGDFTTTQGTAVRTPDGEATLNCHFVDLPPIPEEDRSGGWGCVLYLAGVESWTYQSNWVRTPSGTAQFTCQFSGEPGPLFDALVTVAGVTRPGKEGQFTAPLIHTIPGGRLTEEVVYVGTACPADPLQGDPAGKIALIRRGGCPFTEKIGIAEDAGAIASIVFNNAGDDLIYMLATTGYRAGIPGIFVGQATGEMIRDAAPIVVTLTSCMNSQSCRGDV